MNEKETELREAYDDKMMVFEANGDGFTAFASMECSNTVFYPDGTEREFETSTREKIFVDVVVHDEDVEPDDEYIYTKMEEMFEDAVTDIFEMVSDEGDPISTIMNVDGEELSAKSNITIHDDE